MSTKFFKLKFSDKILIFLKHGDIILNFMTQRTEKWDCFWMVWWCHRIPLVQFFFFFLFFCFELKLIKDTCLRSTRTLTTALWKTSTVEGFMDMDQDACLFFHQDLCKHHETKINDGALKIITYKNIGPGRSKNIAPN